MEPASWRGENARRNELKAEPFSITQHNFRSPFRITIIKVYYEQCCSTEECYRPAHINGKCASHWYGGTALERRLAAWEWEVMSA